MYFESQYPEFFILSDTNYMIIDGFVCIPDGSLTSPRTFTHGQEKHKVSTSSAGVLTHKQRLHRIKQLPLRLPSNRMVDGGLDVLVSVTMGLLDQDSFRVVCSYLTRVELAEYKERDDVISVHPFELEEPGDDRKTLRHKMLTENKKKRNNMKRPSKHTKTWWWKLWNRPVLSLP
jgi:hypothetical protein